MLQQVLVFSLVVSLSGGALADEARQLRIEAAALIFAAENTETGSGERQALLEEAHSKLLKIQNRYPFESAQIQLYLRGKRIRLSADDVRKEARLALLPSLDPPVA